MRLSFRKPAGSAASQDTQERRLRRLRMHRLAVRARAAAVSRCFPHGASAAPAAVASLLEHVRDASVFRETGVSASLLDVHDPPA